VGLIQRISEQREKLIIKQAEPYLEEGEEVIFWVRARRPEGRGEGFVFITPKRCIVHFDSRSEGSGSMLWDDIRAWGLTSRNARGPVLGIESADEVLLAELQVATRSMVDGVATFVERFAELAPEPQFFPRHERLGDFKPHHEVEVSVAKKSLGGHTKRIIVTVIGVVLLLGGLVLSLPLVPGPGFLVVLAGLAVLANEYDWAKDLTNWTRDKAKEAGRKLSRRGRSKS
jgi:uncharacterized protein (TIGR02611 family)